MHTAEVTAGAFPTFQARSQILVCCLCNDLGQYKPWLELTLLLLAGCHIVTLTMLPFRSKHCQNCLHSVHHKADLDGNNLTLLCLGNRVSAWGKPYPQSCFGSLPKIGLNVEARCLSFYFVETSDLNGFMHAKYFLWALLPQLQLVQVGIEFLGSIKLCQIIPGEILVSYCYVIFCLFVLFLLFFSHKNAK